MGVLNRSEIERRLNKGELLRNPRKKKGSFDLESDSYDLAAGLVIWKQRETDGNSNIRCIQYDPNKPDSEQETITLQPGQMVFVITYEDLIIPPELSATVYSRNNLALKGILALNAGHVDPGYDGPIVIRMINLKASVWVLTLGEPVFTVVFHTLDVNKGDKLVKHGPYSREEMIRRVKGTAEDALSNALFDLSSGEIEKRLLSHYSSVQQTLRDSLSEHFDKTYVRQDRLWQDLFKSFVSKAIAFLLFAAAVVTILYIFEVIPWW